MKKLLLLGVLAFAGWYGYHHYGQFKRLPSHEAVIQNHSGRAMERVRLTVDGKTYVRETIEDGQSGVIPFRNVNDSSLNLVWQMRGKEGEPSWTGGLVPRGPMMQRFILAVDGENQVSYTTENKIETP